MATSNFQFFARRHEVAVLLKLLITKHHLYAVANGEILDTAALQRNVVDASQDIERVFLTATVPDATQLVADRIVPAKFGWLQLDLPVESGSNLFLADFSMKSDWYDRERRETRTNVDLSKLFRKLRAELKKHLSSPVWATNTRTGGVAVYRDMAVSEGATRWELCGGELRQPGVDNVRFSGREINSDCRGNGPP